MMASATVAAVRWSSLPRSRWAVAVGGVILVATSAGGWSSGADAGAPVVAAGEIVAAQPDTGDLLALSRAGRVRPLAQGLRSPRGVAVLDDGSVLVAEGNGGRVLGLGGRYGDDPVGLATGLGAPEGVTVGADGLVYLTLFGEGRLLAVDLETGTTTTLIDDLAGPAPVQYVRGVRDPDRVLVGEWFGGRIVSVGPVGGEVTVVAEGLSSPSGLAVGQDGTVYVADRGADAIVALTAGGGQQVLARVDSPSALALDPPRPGPNDPFSLVVATPDDIVRVDPGSGAIEVVAEVAGVAGLAVVAGAEDPAPPTTAEPTPASTAPGVDPAAAPVAEVALAASVDRDALLGPLVVALGAAAVLALGMAAIGTSAAIGRRRAPVAGGGFGPSSSLVAVEPPPTAHGRSDEPPESEVVDDPEVPRSDADSSGLVERPSRRRGRAAAADRRHERNRLVDTLLDDTTWPD